MLTAPNLLSDGVRTHSTWTAGHVALATALSLHGSLRSAALSGLVPRKNQGAMVVTPPHPRLNVPVAHLLHPHWPPGSLCDPGQLAPQSLCLRPSLCPENSPYSSLYASLFRFLRVIASWSKSQIKHAFPGLTIVHLQMGPWPDTRLHTQAGRMPRVRPPARLAKGPPKCCGMSSLGKVNRQGIH